MAREKIIASLDIGNSKIRAVVGILEEGKKIPNVIGVGTSPSLGMREGKIIDPEEIINATTAALEEAERMSGELINHVFVGISGNHIESIDAKGVIAIQGEEITESDVDRVLETAQAISIPSNKRVLKIIPKQFSIDTQKGIRYPVGMVGKKLEVEAHILCGLIPAIKNVEKCIHEAGVDINDIIPNMIAAPEAILTKRQKELGVCLIDIGCGGTTLSVYEEGTLLHTAVIPVGGERVTNDIAIGLRTSLDIAERLKLEYGSCSIEDAKDKEEIDLGSFSRGENQKVSRKHLIEIIEARYYEIFMMVKDELRKINRDGMLPAGAIITGAATKIPGCVDLARTALNLPCQIGFPTETAGVIEKVDDPAYATAIGLLLWGARYDTAPYGFSFKKLDFGKSISSVKSWFQKLLP